MKVKNIVITDADYGATAAPDESSRHCRRHDAANLDALKQELESSTIMPATDAPDDVVTTNSRVRVKDLNSRREFTYQIVFPWNCTDQRAVTGDLA